MKKFIYILAVVMLPMGIPSMSGFAAPSVPTVPGPDDNRQAISSELLDTLARMLEEQGYCRADQAITWYQDGEMTITRIARDTYKVVLPSGVISILEAESL